VEISRKSLILAPTPLHRLNLASDALGIDLWIKRDDLTGFALGGNKGRKIEYFLADAIQRRANVIVTCGATQSNFIRQLAPACRMFGIECVAVVMDLPYETEKPLGLRLDSTNGNSFIDRLVGLETVHIPDDTWDVLFERFERVAAEIEGEGKIVYRIPVGGSTALGAYSFYKASEEVKNQGRAFDWIVTSSSSGSTQAGLTYGFHGEPTKILGIAADPEPDFAQEVIRVGDELAEFLHQTQLPSHNFRVNLNYCGAGYGVSDNETLSAIRWLATTEGILLDPIYTGKAFRGLMDLTRKNQIAGKVLFWHTGGIPNLFALESIRADAGIARSANR
jgi:D-cysteine desulfhydrase family pyridoxal phosphate-dependent enzyme